MASSTKSLELPTRFEDVLAYLPIARIVDYGKGQIIYRPKDVSASIYLLMTGTVEISQIAEDGSEVLLEIVRPEELFGESAFIDDPHRSEQAKAIGRAKVMVWAVSCMEELVMRRPRLAVALLHLLAQRNVEFTRRIESFSLDTIERRLARSLIRFSERLGIPEEDGAVRMMPYTHVLLSRYVGTSRELVTQYMNRFRKQGYLIYSRRGILVYRDALKASIS
jgi:CRP/FNR family transcriptional regulator